MNDIHQGWYADTRPLGVIFNASNHMIGLHEIFPEGLSNLRDYFEARVPVLTVQLEENRNSFRLETELPSHRHFTVRILRGPPTAAPIDPIRSDNDTVLTVHTSDLDGMIAETRRYLRHLLFIGRGITVRLCPGRDIRWAIAKETIDVFIGYDPHIKSLSVSGEGVNFELISYLASNCDAFDAEAVGLSFQDMRQLLREWTRVGGTNNMKLKIGGRWRLCNLLKGIPCTSHNNGVGHVWQEDDLKMAKITIEPDTRSTNQPIQTMKLQVI